VAAAAFGLEMAVTPGTVRQGRAVLSLRHTWRSARGPAGTEPLLARLDALVTGNTLAGLRALPALALAADVLCTGSMARVLGADRRGSSSRRSRPPAAPSTWRAARAHHDDAGLRLLDGRAAACLQAAEQRRPALVARHRRAAGIGMTAKWKLASLSAGCYSVRVHPGRQAAAAQPLPGARSGALRGARAPDLSGKRRTAGRTSPSSRAAAGRVAERAQYWPGQVLYTSIVLVPLWVRGAAWALRSARYRPIGIAAVAVICAQFVLGGKTYYPAAATRSCSRQARLPSARCRSAPVRSARGRSAGGLRVLPRASSSR